MTLRIGDGFGSCATRTTNTTSIVLDLTDPGGPSAALYTPAFYRACASAADARRRDDAARREPDRASRPRPRHARELRDAFSVVTPYLTSIPLYGGLWMMACCAATLDPSA